MGRAGGDDGPPSRHALQPPAGRAALEADGGDGAASAAFHGSRAAADVLVARTGVQPDAFVLAAPAGVPLAGWFDDGGGLRPAAAVYRPDFTDIGWPGRSIEDDTADVLAEALSLAAHLGRTATCEELLDHGADPARAPLYGLTPLHWAASQGHL